jgi:DNA-binding beta-propeller fold protein YncE
MKKILSTLFFLFLLSIILPLHLAEAITVSNGQNASDLIGQYSDVNATIPSYTKKAVNNAPNALGFNTPMGVLTDSINHRLYVTDFSNNRVLIFNLDSSNHLIDHIPDYVLGQPDFNTGVSTNTQSGINFPRDIALDPLTNRLFVAENGGNRVKVFDVTPGTLTSGENALYVLGQTDFSGAGAGDTQSGLNGPGGVAYDTATNRLFVSESGGNRIKVFNAATSTISNGEAATNVIGQADFTSAGAANTQVGLNSPINIAIDPTTSRLFVADAGGNRVKVFNVATSTILATSTPATNVIGQADFTSAGAANTQVGMNVPVGVSLDLVHNRLFVSENSSKVKVYDISSLLATSTPAIHVLGQTTFTTATATSTQSGFSALQSTAYDPISNYLYVAENGGHRIKIFDVSSITDGQNAIDLLGQYTDPFGTTVSYNRSGPNNNINALGLNTPQATAVDSLHHRLFLADLGNNRVLVFNLDSSNHLIDRIPDYVLGQNNFYSNSNNGAIDSQSGINGPVDLAVDEANNRLFVDEYAGNRVKIFDISNITNGEAATNVIGQADFTSAGAGNTQTKLNMPYGMTYDSVNSRLFVSEYNGNRVKVFNVATSTILATSTPATNVIGQADFTSAGAANTQVGMNVPFRLAFDTVSQRLFVSEQAGNRVKIYNVDPSVILATSTPAAHVLGQADFSGASATSTQSGFNGPTGVAFDSSSNRLFVSELGGNRVKIFDATISTLTDNMNASYILGQADFTASGAADSQSGFRTPVGLTYDSSSKQLFVAEQGGNRVKIFDLSDPVAAVVPAQNTGNPLGGYSGGGSGGGSWVGSAQSTTVISNPNSTSTAVTASVTTVTGKNPAAPHKFSFLIISLKSRDLSFGKTGSDVRELQQYLNGTGFTVAASGAGSPGSETAYFGPATRSALARFQRAAGIAPAAGYFGPITKRHTFAN